MDTCLRPKRIISLLVIIFLFFSFLSPMGFSLDLRCGGFKDGGTIPVRYTGFGYNFSPLVFWKDVPDGTKSFALIMEDPDAPRGAWTHWIVYDIPRTTHILKEGWQKKGLLPSGIKQGKNSFRTIGYGGPYPPPGPPHRYVFTLYALDKLLRLPPGIDKSVLVNIMKGHVIEKTSITGMFGREDV